MKGEGLEEGFIALDRLDLKTAHTQFTEILDGGDPDPGDRNDAMLGLALVNRHLGNLERSKALLEEAIRENGQSKEALYDLGTVYSEMGQHALAIQSFDLALTMDQRYVDAYMNRGVSLFNLEEYDQSIQDFKNVLELSPENTTALSNIGLCMFKKQRYESAMEYFDRALSLDDANVQALCGKGLSLYHMDRYDESLICFDAAISTRPEFYIAYFYKGRVLKALDLDAEAERSIEKTLEVRPDLGIAWLELADLRRSKGNTEGALKAYSKAEKYLGKASEEALFRKGQLLLEEGYFDQALECFKKICNVRPHVPKVWLEIARTLIAMEEGQGKIEKALNNVLFLDPLNIDAKALIAESLIRNKEHQKAIDMLKEVTERSSNPRMLLLLSKALLGAERYKDAIMTSDEVQNLDPEMVEAWLVMGRAYGAMGKKEEYRQCLRRYVHKRPNDRAISDEMEAI